MERGSNQMMVTQNTPKFSIVVKERKRTQRGPWEYLPCLFIAT